MEFSSGLNVDWFRVVTLATRLISHNNLTKKIGSVSACTFTARLVSIRRSFCWSVKSRVTKHHSEPWTKLNLTHSVILVSGLQHLNGFRLLDKTALARKVDETFRIDAAWHTHLGGEVEQITNGIIVLETFGSPLVFYCVSPLLNKQT